MGDFSTEREHMALVFIDLDGTALENGKPAKGIVQTIAQLKENGHRPVIATGRTPRLLYGVDALLGIPDFIAANGNYIRYDGRVVYERYIPRDVLSRLLSRTDELGVDLVLEGVDAYVAWRRETELVDRFSDAFQIEYPILDRAYADTHEILAFIVFADEDAKFLRNEFPELAFNRSNRFGFDVNLAGDLKADGVIRLVNYLHYPADHVYAIGDGLNDVSMLKAVKNGIAMGNGCPEAKAAAVHVTTDVGDDGVRNALIHFGLL
jgi:Cof subfamily protein (haloacid dehalogenase superfamily)